MVSFFHVIWTLGFSDKPFVLFSGEICKKVSVSMLRGMSWDQRAGKMLLDVIIAQTEQISNIGILISQGLLGSMV
jgi:hypothetical protein